MNVNITVWCHSRWNEFQLRRVWFFISLNSTLDPLVQYQRVHYHWKRNTKQVLKRKWNILRIIRSQYSIMKQIIMDVLQLNRCTLKHNNLE